MKPTSLVIFLFLALLLASLAAACAQPTPTPVLNTATITPTRPTSTPLPTWTPIPSFTLAPTITPMPTATVVITRTPTSTATYALPNARLIGLGWYDDYDLLVTIQFPAPVTGKYSVKLEDKPYACEVLAKYPDRIYCKGRGVKVADYAEIALYPEGSTVPIYKTRVSIPVPPTFYR